MKFLVKVGSAQAIFSMDQLSKLIELLDQTEVVKSEWVGKAISESGYIEKINRMEVKEMLDLKVMPQVEYDALVVRTELSKEAK